MRTVLPSWLVKTIITVIITAIISLGVTWGSNLTGSRDDHEKRISVVEEHQKGIDQSLTEIKQNQTEQRQDTKEILKMLRRR